MTSKPARSRVSPAEAVSALACPSCGRSLSLVGGSLVCNDLHNFDLARHGYVNLLPGGARPGTADSAAMVSARARFLGSGAFAFIGEAVVAATRDHLATSTEGVVVDVGAGTGWLLAQVLEALPDRSGIALDISKYAARRAASSHPRTFSVVCDAWSTLPLLTGATSAILSFFAPRNSAEFARILARDGLLVVVTPRTDHLEQIITPLRLIAVDPRKTERLEAAFAEHFSLEDVHPLTSAMQLTREQVSDIAAMGPSAHHTVAEQVSAAVAKLADLTEVTASVDIRIMRRRS